MSHSPRSFDEKARELKQALASLNGAPGQRSWQIPYFDDIHTVSEHGVFNAKGQAANPAISVVLMEFVLSGRHDNANEADPVWISYRECLGAGPLMGYFQENTGKTLERTFSGNIGGLKIAGLRLGGDVIATGDSFDLSLRFQALPGIPILLRFNDQEPPFPAACQIMFPESAQHRLDIRSLGVIGTWLTGRLIAAGGVSGR